MEGLKLGRLGWPRSEETKRKISQARKKDWADPDYRLRIQNAMTGIPHLRARKPKGAIPAKEVLENLYLTEGLSLDEIAQIFRVLLKTIRYWLRWYGIKRQRKYTDRARQKMSRSAKARTKHNLALLNQDPEFTRKRLKGALKKPSKPEKQLIQLLMDNGLPYQYVGDGSLIISGVNPDFINNDGQKKIIELFGEWWHSPKMCELYPTAREEVRRAIYGKVGFKMLVIWEHELQDEQRVIAKIKEFTQQ